MPATDPFSGAFYPLPRVQFDQAPREPLPFAAVPRPLHDITSASSNGAGPSVLPRPRPRALREKEGFPSQWAPSQYGGHARGGSEGGSGAGAGGWEVGWAGRGERGAGAEEAEVGGDGWMRARIDALWDKNDGILDLNKQTLTFLSSEIAGLRDYVSLVQVSASPRPPTLRAPPSPDPSLLNNHGLSPASNPFAANGPSFSPFQRTVSAPVSSTFFQQAVGGGRSRTKAEGGQGLRPSALGLSGKEGGAAREAGTGTGTAGRRVVTAHPVLAGPSIVLAPPAETEPPRAAVLGGARPFGRSRTGGAALISGLGVGAGSGSGEGPGSGQRREELTLLLANNLLTALPSALFQVTHLTTLSLRSNKLTHLPPAIGQLCRLKELNIANNLITYLPSTVLDLNLSNFTAFPNKWLEPPAKSALERTDDAHLSVLMGEMRIEGDAGPARQLGPLVSFSRRDTPASPVPRLTDIVIRYLLSPRPPSDLPPLLDEFEWDRTYADEFRPLHKPHPLLDTRSLGEVLPQLHGNELERTLQGLRAASVARQQGKGDRRASAAAQDTPAVYNDNPLSARQGSGGSGSRTSDARPAHNHSHSRTAAERSDDANLNPYYAPCPSPRHRVFAVGQVEPRPQRQVYLRPAEERVEWRDVFGQSGLPVRWEGCSRGCLAFLEEEEEDAWSVDGSEDGF